MCQLILDSHEVNNIDMMHVLNIEHRDAINNLVDEYKSEKYASY